MDNVTYFFAFLGATLTGSLVGILLAELVLRAKDAIQGVSS
jgi:hypothetical protein